MSLWNFSHKPDSDWGEDDSSGKAVQPDHYPNVARPGGGYPEGKGKESDTPCKTCNQNNLVDGRCPLCDWPNSVSEPIKNFPLDPFRDDKAGIRAGSTHSSSEDDYEWENPVAKGVKRWRDKALANFVMFIAEEIDTDMYETGFQPAFPEGWGNGLYESLHDGDYQRFKNIFEGCIEKYNEAMHKYNKEEVEDPSERIEYIDPDTDPKLVWNYFQKTIVGGKAQKKIPMDDRPHILYVITSPVAIKVGITGNGFKTRQQGYKQQNRKQFKNNPEWQWHTDPDELREIPIEGPGGQSTLFFDQQFSPQHLNQFYHTTPYGRNRKIVRSADEQGEIIHYVSPEMKKKTAEVIEARIINWCRDDCMIQTSPIGEQKGKTLPVIKNEQGEEEKVLHMCESIPMANSAGITPDLIAYFIGVMANNGGKAPDLGEYGKEWLQSNFNISDENFDQMFSGEFGQELGLNNQPEASSVLEQGQIQNQEINPNQQTLWNFNELSQEYPQAYPEGYTQEDVDDQESAMKWYELNGRNDKAGIRAGSWKFITSANSNAKNIFFEKMSNISHGQNINDVKLLKNEDGSPYFNKDEIKYLENLYSLVTTKSVRQIISKYLENMRSQSNASFAPLSVKILSRVFAESLGLNENEFYILKTRFRQMHDNFSQGLKRARTKEEIKFMRENNVSQLVKEIVNADIKKHNGVLTLSRPQVEEQIRNVLKRRYQEMGINEQSSLYRTLTADLSKIKVRNEEKLKNPKLQKAYNERLPIIIKNLVEEEREAQGGSISNFDYDDFMAKLEQKIIEKFPNLPMTDSEKELLSQSGSRRSTILEQRFRSNLDDRDAMFTKRAVDFNDQYYVYAFQSGSTIKVGIANDMVQRIRDYRTDKFKQWSPVEVERIKEKLGPEQAERLLKKRKIERRFDVPKLENWSVIDAEMPSDETLLERGNTPYSEENPGETSFSWSIRNKFRKQKPPKLHRDYIKRPNTLKKDREKYERQKLVLSQNQNPFYVSKPVSGWVAKNTEAAIMSWWAGLDAAMAQGVQTSSETITLDPNNLPHKTQHEIANDISLDLVVFLIEKLIENGGHMNNLNMAFKEGDEERLLNFFDNDPNKMIKVLGMTADSEGKYSFGSEMGGALGIDNLLTGHELMEFDENENIIAPDLSDPEFAQEYEELFGRKQPLPTKRDVQFEQRKQDIFEKGLMDPNDAKNYWRRVDPAWENEPKPQVEIPQQQEQDYGLETGVPINTPVQIDNRIVMLDGEGKWWQSYNGQWLRIGKTADHQGSTNWETWNTKVMIDNEYNHYMQSREMVKNFTPLNEFAIWATQAVIAPHNKQALEDAQEWNDIPYDERPTGREHMSEGGQALTEGFDEIFGMDPRADETASIIDESKVDWPQIYNSIAEDIKESERFDHEEGKHDLLTQMYMTDFTAEELGNLQEETYPWCPICKIEHPDDPGDLTIPSDWTQ